MTPSIRTALLLPTAFIACAAFGDGALTIREIAPDSAFLVIGADDIHGTLSRLEPTALGKLWNDPDAAEKIAEIREAFEEGIREAASEAGVDEDAVTWPSSAGAAVVIDLDEDLGLPTLDFMFFVDWTGIAGDEDGAKATKLLETLVANAESDTTDEGGEVRVEEIRGRRVLVMKPASGDDEDDFGGDGFDEGFDDEFGMMDMGLPDLGDSEMCMAADGARLLVASSPEAMDMLLARVDGDHSNAMGGSDTFRESVELAGGTQDVYGVLSTEAAQPIFGLVPQLMLVQPLISQVFGDIKAWSFGAHAKDGVLEQSAGIYMPNGKSGLFAMLDESTEAGAPPAVVPSDALSYGRFNVRLDTLLDVVDGIVGGMPAEQSEMIGPMLEMYRPAMRAAFSALGPAVHTWGREVDPNDPFAGTSVTAISMKGDKESAAAVSDLLSLFGLGLEARDFNGMTILSDEFSPMAVGMGGGFLVLGSTLDVERALRAVDAKGDEGLAGDATFKRALDAMPKEPVVGFAYWDVVRLMSSSMAMIDALEGQMGEFGADEDGLEIPGVGAELPGADDVADLLTEDLMKRCFGATYLTFTSTPKGFSTAYRMAPGTGE